MSNPEFQPSGLKGYAIAVYRKKGTGSMGIGTPEYYINKKELMVRLSYLVENDQPFTCGHIHRGTIMEDIPNWYIARTPSLQLLLEKERSA